MAIVFHTSSALSLATPLYTGPLSSDDAAALSRRLRNPAPEADRPTEPGTPPQREPQPRRQRKPRPARLPDGGYSSQEAAAKLRISTKTLDAHADAGEITFFTIGLGRVRPRRRYTDSDLNDFIAKRREAPCPSVATQRGRRTTTTTSKSTVVAFSELRRRRPYVKPKR